MIDQWAAAYYELEADDDAALRGVVRARRALHGDPAWPRWGPPSREPARAGARTLRSLAQGRVVDDPLVAAVHGWGLTLTIELTVALSSIAVRCLGCGGLVQRVRER